MSETRRRSMSWMKEFVTSPHRIAVASLEISKSSKPNPGSDIRVLDLNRRPVNPTPADPNGVHFEENKNNVQKDPENLEFTHTRALEHYFRFLHCMGLASLKRFWKNTYSASYVIHKILLWIFSCFAILDSVKLIKLCSVTYVKRGDLYRYTTVGRYVLNCAKRINLVVLLSSGSRQIFKIFNELHSVRESYKKPTSLKISVFCFGIVSLVVALMNVIFRWASLTGGWSPTAFFFEQSYDMSLSLLVWTTNDTISNEQSNILYELYTDNFTPVTILFGIMGIGMEICGLIMDYVAYDIMFFSAITLYKLTNQLQVQLIPENSNVEEVLKQYEQLQNVSKSIEEAFGGLFKISHASNLLSCAHFLLIFFLERNYHFGLIFMLLRIAKVWLTCYLSTKATTINKSYRQWVRSAIIGGNRLDGEIRTLAILEESIEFPVGIGSDSFFIDETFLLKFATMVGTFALFLIESKRKSEEGEI